MIVLIESGARVFVSGRTRVQDSNFHQGTALTLVELLLVVTPIAQRKLSLLYDG